MKNSTRLPRVGKLEVLHSNAGYYIGKLYYGPDGCTEPYSRESGYYKTKEAAEYALVNNEYCRY